MQATVWRRLLLVVIDAVGVALAVWLSYAIRFDGAIPTQYWRQLPWVIGALVGVRVVCLALAGLYQQVWMYAGGPELLTIVGATTAGSVLAVASRTGWPGPSHVWWPEVGY